MMLPTAAIADTNKVASAPAPQRQGALYTRVMLVENAQNLKHVKGLDPKKPLQELVLDYLTQNGVELQSPSYARFDAKTQELTIHASNAVLDKVQILLPKLREKH